MTAIHTVATIMTLALAVALPAAPAGAGSYGTAPVARPVAEPARLAGVNWQGAYLGLQLGTLQAIHTLDFPDRGVSAGLNSLRFDGGVFGGYNWQRPNGLVIGIEGEYNLADFRSRARGITGGTAAADYCVCIDATAAVRARVGYARNRTLIYATVGLAASRMTLRRHDPVSDAVLQAQTGWRGGWTVGVGIEHALRDNWSLRLDFRHSDHGTRTYGPPFPETVISRRVRSSEVRLGLSRRF